MQLLYYRMEEGDEHFVYFMDPALGRGFKCGASPRWEYVHLYDEPKQLGSIHFIGEPIEVPDHEFRTLIAKLDRYQPEHTKYYESLRRFDGTLDPRETPTITSIVEEDLTVYLQRRIREHSRMH